MNQNEKFFPENNQFAEESLQKVSQEWLSGKQQINWAIAYPKRKKDFYISVITATLLVPFIVAMMLLKLKLFLHYIVAIVIFSAIATMFSMLRSKKNRYEYCQIMIDRTKRTVKSNYKKSQYFAQYGDNLQLPAFRLPENTEYYQNMRENLQKNIAAETGFSFNEDIEKPQQVAEQKKKNLTFNQTDICPEDSQYAIKTLNKVSQEWDSGKTMIKYAVKIPKDKKQYKKSFLIGCVYLLVFVATALFAQVSSGHKIDMGYMIFVSLFMIFLYFVLIKPEISKYTKYTVIIHRKKKYISSQTMAQGKNEAGRYRKGKFGENFDLYAFRLPENDTGEYERLRQTLQAKITAETGCAFNEFLQ